MKKLNLTHAVDLFDLKTKLTEYVTYSEDSTYSPGIRMYLQRNDLRTIIRFIQDQRAQGHDKTLAYTFGRQTINLVDKLSFYFITYKQNKNEN